MAFFAVESAFRESQWGIWCSLAHLAFLNILSYEMPATAATFFIQLLLNFKWFAVKREFCSYVFDIPWILSLQSRVEMIFSSKSRKHLIKRRFEFQVQIFTRRSNRKHETRKKLGVQQTERTTYMTTWTAPKFDDQTRVLSHLHTKQYSCRPIHVSTDLPLNIADQKTENFGRKESLRH